MKKKICLLFFLTLGKLALSQQLTISATFAGFSEGTKFSLYDRFQEKIVAEALIRDGRFTLNAVLLESPTIVILETAISSKTFAMLVGNENIFLSGDYNNFRYATSVTGSKYHDQYQAVKKLTMEYDKEREIVSEGQWDLIKDTSEAAKTKINFIAKKQAYLDKITDSIGYDFAKKNPNSFASADLLFRHRKKLPKVAIETLYNQMGEDIKENYLGRRLTAFLHNIVVLKKGDFANDFLEYDSKGNQFSLKNLKGKYVLLDFVQSYCVPCVLLLPELKEIHNIYKDKLAIVSFYADKEKGSMLSAIEKHKPDWLCIWDGKGMYSETLLQYGITSFPVFMLIDPFGKIVSIINGYTTHGKHLFKAIEKSFSND